MILLFYLPYHEDYDYDSWHGFSRYVFRNIFEQQFDPLTAESPFDSSECHNFPYTL